MPKSAFPAVFAASLAFLAPPEARAVGLGLVFGSHMVLQRNMPVPVWGDALPGETITVTFRGQSKAMKAGTDGRWRVTLDPMPAGGPFRLVARGLDSLVLEDVMVGEVWVGGGQSNMEGTLEALGGELDSARAAHIPDLRLFTMWGDKTWRRCDPTAALRTSATAFFFAKRVQAELGIPVGMLVSAVGGTAVEQWIDTATVAADPTFRGDSLAGGGFRAMITPIIPMAMRGVIWYQGESNTAPDSTVRWSYKNYRRRFAQLIPGWRKAWGIGDFPFLFVQLPEHHARQTRPVEVSSFAEVREGQRLNLDQPNTAMAVTLGLGDADDIHPRKKSEVGRRLALCALALPYGRKDAACGGPMFADLRAADGALRLRFRPTEGGLRAGPPGAAGAKLEGFTIAGADGRWAWADALIAGDTVIVSSPLVPVPVKARYAWADNPIYSLHDGAGLPASPFRTDGPQLPVPVSLAERRGWAAQGRAERSGAPGAEAAGSVAGTRTEAAVDAGGRRLPEGPRKAPRKGWVTPR